MRDLPDGIETAAVVEALADGWGYDTDTIEYAALGFGSYHWIATAASGTRWFVTVDDLDQKRWLGGTREAARGALGRAFGTAAALRQAGLEFVVAPIRTASGEPLHPIGDRHTAALFPFVDGQAGRFGDYEPGARAAVVSMLADLHRADPAATGALGVGLELAGRPRLEAALRDVNGTWFGGPLSEPARQAFTSHAADVAALLSVADRLAAAVEERGRAWVITHGEPHAGNVMRTGAAHVLVDWDTVALAPRERDLWAARDEPDDLAAYADLSREEIDRDALDFFRLTWDLKDIAEYLNVLRSPHDENDDTRTALEGITRSMSRRDEWLR